jgi:hypothetical protein
MRISLSLLLFLFLYACTDQQAEVKHYGALNRENLEELELDLGTVDEYEEVSNFILNTVCDDKFPILSFKLNEVIYKIAPIDFCWGLKWNPPLRELLIFNESNMIEKSGKQYPLDSIQSLFRKDFFNTENHPDFTSDPNRLFLIIKQKKDSPVENLITVLKRIAISYEELNSSTRLNILLVHPPPPPPTGINERDN